MFAWLVWWTLRASMIIAKLIGTRPTTTTTKNVIIHDSRFGCITKNSCRFLLQSFFAILVMSITQMKIQRSTRHCVCEIVFSEIFYFCGWIKIINIAKKKWWTRTTVAITVLSWSCDARRHLLSKHRYWCLELRFVYILLELLTEKFLIEIKKYFNQTMSCLEDGIFMGKFCAPEQWWNNLFLIKTDDWRVLLAA